KRSKSPMHRTAWTKSRTDNGKKEDASVKTNLSETFRPRSGALEFFTSILIWGIGTGCFMAAMNNYLSEICRMNSLERGWLEFFRELPGLSLVFILALLHRVSDWKVMRIGTMISMAGAAFLLVPANKIFVTGFIMIYSLGEHLVMPVRQSIALSIAKTGKSGESLGIVTSAINTGTVAGSLLVAAVFFFGIRWLRQTDQRLLYDVVWCMIVLFLAVSVALGATVKEPGVASRPRPTFYFRRKYLKFYGLELFYGARKQVFFTFGPFVLIKLYGMSTKEVALLFGISAFLTALWGGRLIGRLTDRWGYRNVMIWDTVVLFFVCLLYGFAKDIFPPKVAVAAVCVNYILDAVISNASIATNLYARTLSDSQEELTATLSSGISVNHVITVFYAIFGGWIFDRFGPGVLFATAALMALANSAFALTIPKPTKA
ncbi:MAG: MFS transporter, partial [Kiritimatiellae bacterium]|nr:MFS transporter [Kiritimatiellia bacterium]